MSKKILIIDARFYEEISDALLAGAIAVLKKASVSYDHISVPGALEIPAAISIAHASAHYQYDGYIALGCVIRGETTHYDTVCNESARGLNDLALQHQLAIGNGILTVENEEQAMKRADSKRLNKGGSAAEACLRMIELQFHFGLRSPAIHKEHP